MPNILFLYINSLSSFFKIQESSWFFDDRQLNSSNMQSYSLPRELFEKIKAENFPKLGKDTGIKIQEAQKTPIQFKKLTIAKALHSQIHKIHKQGKNPGSNKGKISPLSTRGDGSGS